MALLVAVAAYLRFASSAKLSEKVWVKGEAAIDTVSIFSTMVTSVLFFLLRIDKTTILIGVAWLVAGGTVLSLLLPWLGVGLCSKIEVCILGRLVKTCLLLDISLITVPVNVAELLAGEASWDERIADFLRGNSS